uniref:Sugar ABC transporter permease n=1 Tax=OCS116 cluster bacterium TaxID=2030921 RepID=A0A2A4Z073_9PROT
MDHHQTQNPQTKWFLWPAIIVMMVVAIYTTGYAIYMSLHDISLLKRPPYEFVGLEQITDLLGNARTHFAFLRSFVYVFVSVGIQLLLGIAISLYLNREFMGRGIVRAFLLIPLVMTPVVVGLIWRLFYDPNNGIINWLLSTLFGIGTIDWLGNPTIALGSLMIAEVWQWTPFIILITMASLDGMPTDPIEAAKIDGASEWQIFKFITLPLLLPTLVIGGMIRAIDSFKVFDLIFVMTRGGPALSTETVNMYAYIEAFSNFNLGKAVAISFVMTLIVSIGMTWLYSRIVRMD